MHRRTQAHVHVLLWQQPCCLEATFLCFYYHVVVGIYSSESTPYTPVPAYTINTYVLVVCCCFIDVAGQPTRWCSYLRHCHDFVE